MMGALDEFLAHWAEVRQSQARADSASASRSTAAAPDASRLARVRRVDVAYQPVPGSADALLQRVRSEWDISFPQAMLWGVLGTAAGFAITIVRERKQGTLFRLQAAPISRTHILLGKAVACFTTVIGVVVTMAILGRWLGMQPRSPAMLAVAAICVAFAFTGIMVLMSVIGRTEEAVSGAAWLANMVMAMFGGGMIPLAFMPEFMATLSQASPVKWSVLALEGAIWRGFSWVEMALPCAILLGFGCSAMLLGAFRLARTSD
jgi:ABC-2 type transport system permease protein